MHSLISTWYRDGFPHNVLTKLVQSIRVWCVVSQLLISSLHIKYFIHLWADIKYNSWLSCLQSCRKWPALSRVNGTVTECGEGGMTGFVTSKLNWCLYPERACVFIGTWHCVTSESYRGSESWGKLCLWPEVSSKLSWQPHHPPKYFSNLEVLIPFSNTTDPGLWSICSSHFSLYSLVESMFGCLFVFFCFVFNFLLHMYLFQPGKSCCGCCLLLMPNFSF